MERVFVTGMGVVSAIGRSVEEFLSSLRCGRSGIGAIRPEADAEAIDVGAAIDFSFADELARLERLSPRAERARIAARAPLSVQASVLSCLQAWVDAGLDGAPMSADRIGIAATGDSWLQRIHGDAADKYRAAPEYVPPRYALHGFDTDCVATVSEVLEVRGEGFAVGGASAGGNVALVKAWQAIGHGEMDVCLAVGAPIDLSPVARQAFRNLGALAGGRFRGRPELACRPFDAERDGFVPGQGGGCLLLESERSAAARRAAPRAEVLAGALLLDGNRLAHPSADGEVRAMRRCMERAGIDPGDVDYVNAHGSSSVIGDRTEAEAIVEAFGDQAGRVWVNSTKSLTGHCLSSAGIVEAIACVLQLENRFVHANLNLRDPDDLRCRFAGPEAQPAALEIALSNSFGFGGINSCVALRRGGGR